MALRAYRIGLIIATVRESVYSDKLYFGMAFVILDEVKNLDARRRNDGLGGGKTSP